MRNLKWHVNQNTVIIIYENAFEVQPWGNIIRARVSKFAGNWYKHQPQCSNLLFSIWYICVIFTLPFACIIRDGSMWFCKIWAHSVICEIFWCIGLSKPNVVSLYHYHYFELIYCQKCRNIQHPLLLDWQTQWRIMPRQRCSAKFIVLWWNVCPRITYWNMYWVRWLIVHGVICQNVERYLYGTTNITVIKNRCVKQ